MWQRVSGWYEDWVRHNDYVRLLMDRLRPLTNGRSRVLEIGPGVGGLTVPLAVRVREVVAVEPSADMRAALGRKLASARNGNVRVIPKTIEEGLKDIDGHFDLALASYSLYNVEAIDKVMRGLVKRSEHVVALMGTGEGRSWYRDLERQFRDDEPVSPPQVQYLYPALLEMGIYADVEVFWTSRNYVFDSEAALVAYWMHRFGLSERERPALRAVLLDLAERRGSQIGIYGRSRAALVSIERGRNA
jgi:hypothetical protein